MRCVVTGALKMLGRHLTSRLRQLGHTVVEVDSTATHDSIKQPDRDLRVYAPGYKIEPDTFLAVMRGVDAVFHTASPPPHDPPTAQHRGGPTLTLALLEAAAAAGVKHFVQSSDSSVYGEQFLISRMTEALPDTVPAAAKTASEAYCLAYASRLDVRILRYFHVYGPYQEYRHAQRCPVVPAFFRARLAGQAATIAGDGEQTRYFTYVDDVVDANLLALTDTSYKRIHNVYGVKHSINELHVSVAKALDMDVITPVYVAPRRPDGPPHTIVAPRSLSHGLTSLADGLAQTTPYYCELFRGLMTS